MRHNYCNWPQFEHRLNSIDVLDYNTAMFNPHLSAPALAAKYAIDQRVRIPSVLQTTAAQQAMQYCASDVPFDLVCHVDGKSQSIDLPTLKAMTPDQHKAMQTSMMREAGNGVGFMYGGFVASRARDSEVSGLKFLYDLYQQLNSDEILNLVRTITATPDIQRADGQYTCYRPGQYLTRHLDNPQGEERRVAYVLSLSPEWHPDWGGLLQFYENNGTPRDAWAPVFNSMALFDVRHVHSVTYVAPFAKVPRFSLTGWFYAS